MSEFTNPKLLALALMCASFTGGCDLIDSTMKSIGASDPAANLNQPVAFYSETPADVTVDPDIIPEPAYVPPEPPPLGCEPHRNWRYMIFACQDRQIGTYGDE